MIVHTQDLAQRYSSKSNRVYQAVGIFKRCGHEDPGPLQYIPQISYQPSLEYSQTYPVSARCCAALTAGSWARSLVLRRLVLSRTLMTSSTQVRCNRATNHYTDQVLSMISWYLLDSSLSPDAELLTNLNNSITISAHSLTSQ